MVNLSKEVGRQQNVSALFGAFIWFLGVGESDLEGGVIAS